MSVCGARETVEVQDESVDVVCSLPEGHAEQHAGRVWWSE